MRAVLFALLLTGCQADSLVVVTVDASPSLDSVALLHTSSMAGGQTILQDVGSTAAPFSVGGGTTKTFAIQVPASITGAFSIHVEAQDAGGKKLAQGDGSTTIVVGQRVDIAVTLTPPPILSQPFYVGAGGSAASATQQIGINIGGTNTVGTSTAASGATFQSGFFPIQTY